MNPLSVRYKGDRTIGEQFLGEGKRLLYLLKQKMGIGNLDQDQFMRHYRDANGLEAKIKAQSIFGKDFITIEPISPAIKPKQIIIPREEMETKKYVYAWYDNDFATPYATYLWVYRNGTVNKYTVFDEGDYSIVEEAGRTMAMHKSGLIVCAEVSGTDPYPVLLKASTDWGKTFSSIFTISVNSGYTNIDIEIDDDGTIYIAWADYTLLNAYIYKSNEITKDSDGVITDIVWIQYSNSNTDAGGNITTVDISVYKSNVALGFTDNNNFYYIYKNGSRLSKDSVYSSALGVGINRNYLCYYVKSNATSHKIYRDTSLVWNGTSSPSSIYTDRFVFRVNGIKWVVNSMGNYEDNIMLNNILISEDDGSNWIFHATGSVATTTDTVKNQSCDIARNMLIYHKSRSMATGVAGREVYKGVLSNGAITWEQLYYNASEAGTYNMTARVVEDKLGSMTITTKEEQKINV